MYRIDKSIRDMCIFARHNLIADPPFGHVDLVSCRNVLIYMSPALQKRVIPMFHYALENPGFLVLGTSETVAEFGDLFEQINREYRIFAKKARVAGHRTPFSMEAFGLPHVPTSHAIGGARTSPSEFHREADRLLFDRYAPPGVLVGERFEVIEFRGRTGPYLETPPGEPTSDLLKMAREGLFLDLRTALEEARQSGKTVRREGVRMVEDGGFREVDLHVEPVKPAGSSQTCFLVLFEEHATSPAAAGAAPKVQARPASRSRFGRWIRGETAPDSGGPFTQEVEAARSGQLDQLRRELEATKHYMQSLVEQREAANEELRSANEEILSSNEELQSTNEELETAKEELQSANEELITVNEQLQHRNTELIESTNDVTNLLASTSIPVVMVGNDLRIRFVSPGTKAVWNVLQADIGRPLAHIKPNVELPDLDEMIAKAIDTVQVQQLEVQDRSGHWYLLRVHPYRTADRRVDGAVLVLIDIEQAKQVVKLLREREAYFRELMQSMPHVVWTSLPDGKTDFINRRWREYTGQEPLTDRTMPEAWQTLLHPDDREAAGATYRKGMTKGSAFEFEARLLRASDGAYRWNLFQAVPFEDEGKPVKFLGTCTDIDDLKKAEQALLRADRRKDEFLATLSHELRNPLGAIRNAAEMIREARADPESIRKGGEILRRQTDHMILLVDDLLDLSRILERKIVLSRSETLLSSVVEAAVETVRESMVKNGHDFTVSMPAEPVKLVVDPVRIAQVVGNLLTNAAKFTPRGGKITLTASVEPGAVQTENGAPLPLDPARENQHLEIRVCDNGIGIPEELLPNVFDLFVQAEQPIGATSGGLGVGLTLVRGLVRMHGGSVDVKSEGKGQGCEFTVRLPFTAAPREERKKEPKGRIAPPASGAPRRILLIDDNVDHAETLRMLLQRAGHEVRLAPDGMTGLEVAREFVPDVALVDIGLPGWNGFEVARRMREVPELAKTTIAALTGYGQESDHRRVENARFDRHFVKPVDFAELRRWLEPAPQE